MQYVETDTPPQADGSDSAETALKALCPADTGTTLDFSSQRNLSATFAHWVSIRQTLDEVGSSNRN